MAQRLLIVATWFLPAIIFSVAVARISVWMQQGERQSALLPLVVGVVIGGVIFGLGRFANEPSVNWMIAGAVIAAMVCAAAEHGFFYVDYLTHFARQPVTDAKLLWLQGTGGGGEAAEFGQFLAAAARRPGFGGWPSWVSWIGHAVQIAIAAAVTVWLLSRERLPTSAH